VLDAALDSIADAGPDLRNGLTNHAPMAVESLLRPSAAYLAAARRAMDFLKA